MKNLTFIVNVDWYFFLHWVDRAIYFKNQGYEIYLVTSVSDKKYEDLCIFHGINLVDVKLKRATINPFFDIIPIVKYLKVLKKINPSIIHCVTIKPNIYIGIINRLFVRCPIIYSVTGLGATFSSNETKFRLIKKIIVLLYRFISVPNSRFVFENKEDYQLFKNTNILNGNGVVIKGAGIDLDRFYPTSPPRENIVLFAARLLKDKGLYELVEAAKILRSRNKSFTIKVAGILDQDVSNAIPISLVKDWENAGLIVWLGNVENMPELIQCCDVVCLPTKYGEGVPRILIEAASCQRPIVTTDVTGCRELVKHNVNGLLVEPGSPESLACALDNLLDNFDKMAKLGRAGRHFVQQEFAQEIVFNKTKDVYNSLLDI